MVVDGVPRAELATLPTPLEGPYPIPAVGAEPVRLWIKRDDLTGLGGGGNKVRKLEFLCGDALAAGADTLVTVGAAQSNHCRMTAAAGGRLGMRVHLVLSGERPDRAAGNVLLDELFGAQLHFTGAHHSHWGALEIAREDVAAGLAADGLRPYSVPIGGSTAIGALGYVVAFGELAQQCAAVGIDPVAVVTTSSSGGTHAGLLAGRALGRAGVADSAALAGAEIVAVGVAKGVVAGLPDPVALADAAIDVLAATTPAAASVRVDPADVIVVADYLGDDYGVPTAAGDAAIRWGARTAGLLLDRTYSGKGLAGVLGLAGAGRWPAGSDVVFVHTGGWPALFADGGAPAAD